VRANANVASALGQGEDAAEWFAGGVVAYRVATKTSLLRVTEGLDPSTPECAAQLAAHGRELLAVDVCVAVTGVGGPEPSDGHPAGEVHLGLATVDGVTTSTHRFEGDPADVVVLSVRAAVAALAEGVTAQADAAASGTVGRDARDARGEHANLRLYRDCGYVETERVDQGDGTAQVFLRKRLRD